MRISKNKQCIEITLSSDEILYLTAVGDCCSESWFEHIQDISEIKGMSIVDVEEIYLGEVTPTIQEHDQLYAIKFTTNGKWKDSWMLEFRNSSNGFYGGWCTLASEPLDEYSDEYDENDLKECLDFV